MPRGLAAGAGKGLRRGNLHWPVRAQAGLSISMSSTHWETALLQNTQLVSITKQYTEAFRSPKNISVKIRSGIVPCFLQQRENEQSKAQVFSCRRGLSAPRAAQPGRVAVSTGLKPDQEARPALPPASLDLGQLRLCEPQPTPDHPGTSKGEDWHRAHRCYVPTARDHSMCSGRSHSQGPW